VQPLRRLVLVLLVSVFARAALAAAPDAPFDPSGQWVGVYQSYPYFVRMTLSVPAAHADGHATTEADLRLEPLFEMRTIGRSPMGVIHVTVDFDTTARTLAVQTGADAYRQLGVQVPGFSGVYDSQQKVIGGVLTRPANDASPNFVLGKADVASAAFLDRLEVFGSNGGARPGINPLSSIASKFGGGGSVSEARLREWAGQFIKEYPNIDAYNTEMGRLFVSARNLFRDESFRPYFGTTFDQMSSGIAQSVQRQLRQTPPPRGNFPEERVNGVLRVMERPFTPQLQGTYMGADMVLSVIAMRAITGWRKQTLDRIASAPAAIGSWHLYQAADAAAADVLANDWPSQQQAFATALAEARARTAGPILQARVDDLLKGSGAHDPAQLNAALAALKSPAAAPKSPAANRLQTRRTPGSAAPSESTSAELSLSDLAVYASPDLRDAQAARLTANLSSTVNSECGTDRSSIASLGSGLAGLEANGRKYLELSRKYASLGGPSQCSVFGELQAARHGLLAGAEPELTSRLQKARDASELSSITSTYLSVMSDRQDAAGARLLNVADQRSSELQRQQQVAAAQRAEQERTAACTAASNQQEGGEPTERDMCMAFAQTLEGGQENIESMKGACNDLHGPSANAGTAIMCLMGGAVSASGGMGMSIAGFEKIACVSAAPAGKPGYFCDYTMRIVTSNPTLGSIMNRFGGETATARFVKSKGIWRVIPQPSSDN
jgi:hypothetical protein